MNKILAGSFKRGQVNSIDFIAAMIFLTFIIVFFISFTAVQQNNNFAKLRQDTLLVAGTTITDIMIESEGAPSDWETGNISDIQAIGLASSPNELSTLKVNRFLLLDYNTSKTLISLPSNIDYYFSIVNTSGSVLNQSGIDSSTSNRSFLFTRYVIWNGSAAWMRLRLYE